MEAALQRASSSPCSTKRGALHLMSWEVLSGNPAPFPAGGVLSCKGYDTTANPAILVFALLLTVAATRAPFPMPTSSHESTPADVA